MEEEDIKQEDVKSEIKKEEDIKKEVETLDDSYENIEEGEIEELEVVEKQREEPKEDDEEEDDEEEDEKPIVADDSVEEEEEEEDWSQYGKEGNNEALNEAYIAVESLAAEILAVDPKNAMVAQLTPHLSGVLRAMEEGQTEGLLDTLKHIEVILEDVKKRLDEKMVSN